MIIILKERGKNIEMRLMIMFSYNYYTKAFHKIIIKTKNK